MKKVAKRFEDQDYSKLGLNNVTKRLYMGLYKNIEIFVEGMCTADCLV